MRTKLLILAAACSLAASAQQVEITSRQQLLKGTESGICNPVLSADGQKLLFTHADYKGLKLYDFSSDVTTTIATDDMAGFHPSFSRDGKSVYFLSQTREDMRVYREVKAYNLEARTSIAVTEKARGMQAPVAVDGGFAAVSDNGRKLKADRKGGTYVYARGAQLIVVRNGKEQQLQPVATDHTYMWESLPSRAHTCATLKATCWHRSDAMRLRAGLATTMWLPRTPQTTATSMSRARLCF